MSDGTSTQIPLTHNMVSTEDLAKFQQEGTHTINVSYMNATTSFQITIKGEKGDPGTDGREVANGYILWKYSGDTDWTNLVNLSDFSGTDGKEVTFQVADGYIQWQYVGDTTWSNLIELSTLTGSQGEAGTDGKEVTFQVADDYIKWRYVGDTIWSNLIKLSTLTGPQNWISFYRES